MEPSRPSRAGQSLALILLSAATVTMAASPVFAYGVLAPILNAELGMSPTQIGGLSTAFYLVAALSTTWTGRATDRLGAHGMTLAVLCAAAFSHLSLALAPIYAVMLVSAVIGGLAIGASNPTTNILLAERLDKALIGLGTGLKQAGVPAAAVLVGAVLPSLVAAIGWRSAAASVAVTGLAIAAATRLVLGPGRGAERRYGPAPAGRVTAQVRKFAAFAGLMGGTSGVVNAHLALYATSALGFSPAAAGALFAGFGLAGLLSRIFWAQIAGRMAHPHWLLVGLGLIAALSCLLFEVADGMPPWVSWIGVLLMGASGLGWQGVVMVAVIRSSAFEQLGFQSGYVMRMFFLGLFSTPILFGLWVDHSGGYDRGWMAVGFLGLLAAAFARPTRAEAG